MITARSCDGHSSLRESFGICEFYPGKFSSEKMILFENALKKRQESLPINTTLKIIFSYSYLRPACF